MLLKQRLAHPQPKGIRFLGGLLLAAAACIVHAGQVEDAQVRAWIASSLTGGLVYSPEVDQVAAKTYPVDALQIAWARLKQCRDTGDSLDLNLAAAEHYMFMRFVSAQSGDTGYRLLPKAYAYVKEAATAANLLSVLQTSDQPVSPPSTEVTQWGTSGVEKGLADFKLREHQEPIQKANSIVTAVGFTYTRFYYDAAGLKSPSKGHCQVPIAPAGIWESTDPGGRWRLEFKGDRVAWIERNAAGAAHSVEVPLRTAPENSFYRIARPNDEPVLRFLGFAADIRAEVLKRSPVPSYMNLSIQPGKLQADWYGLLVIKDAAAKFKELKQPGQSPAKPYEFTRKPG